MIYLVVGDEVHETAMTAILVGGKTKEELFLEQGFEALFEAVLTEPAAQLLSDMDWLVESNQINNEDAVCLLRVRHIDAAQELLSKMQFLDLLDKSDQVPDQHSEYLKSEDFLKMGRAFEIIKRIVNRPV